MLFLVRPVQVASIMVGLFLLISSPINHALAPVSLAAAEGKGGEQGGQEEMTEQEAIALLAAGNQALRDSNETPSRSVDAALAFIKVLPYYKRLGQTDMICDIEAAVFWAKKRMNIDDVNRFLTAKGGSEADIALLATADQVTNRAVSLEEAQLYYDRAEKFAADNPSSLGRIAARWFEVAERFVGTELGSKAHKFSLAAQKKDIELLALERTAKSETIFSQPEIIYDASTLISPPSETEIKAAIITLKKERKEDFAKRHQLQITKLITGFINEAKINRLDSSRRMAFIRSAMDMSADLNDLHKLLTLGELEASIFTGASVRDRQRAALQLKRSNTSAAAVIKLFEDPQDANANMLVGRHYCLELSRWDDGIPMLARSSDKDLKELAGMELIRPEGWMQQVELGDRWFDTMKKSHGPAKQSMAIRSHHWYSRAKPQLSGITQVRIAQRLEDLAEHIPMDQVNFATLTAKQWDRLPAKAMDIFATSQRQDVGLVLKKGMTIRIVPHPNERWTMDYQGYSWSNHGWGNVFDTNYLGQEGEKNIGRTLRGDNRIRIGAMVMTLEKRDPMLAGILYRGELVFVDHVNRRGSIRVQGSGMFRRNDPHPFAMLPYGIVRYQGAPADLRDIPLGTVLHVRGFLPPDPKTSAVPVLPVDSKTKDANHNRGAGILPAENHVLLLEDEPSHCEREGLVWKLKEVEIKNREGMIVATREPKQGGDGKASEEKMTFDAATRIWRGRECLGIVDLITEGAWPADGKKSLGGQAVQLGITWKPTPDGIFTRFHISDIWLDEKAMQHAAQLQTETHRAFIRSRWMPAWIDAVEYGKFGRATVTATLFGGMDASLYADFIKGNPALMNAVENTLKHTHGAYGPAHMASKGPIVDVTKAPGEAPLGSSGIQIRFETDLIIEGIRPGRVVRIRPASWPQVQVPREEYVGDSLEERFPTPAIFPKY